MVGPVGGAAAGSDGETMRRVIAIVACGLTLAACSTSWAPSLNFLSPTPQTMVARFESEPPAAEARTSTGQTCRTPCALALPAQDFTVTFTLDRYLPQTIPVQVHIPDYRNAGDFSQSSDFLPNPVVAALEPAPPPPPPPRKKRVHKRKRPATARVHTPPRKPAPPPSAAPAASAPATSAPPANTFTPPPTSPWPAPR
jgi:hypothetical protein